MPNLQAHLSDHLVTLQSSQLCFPSTLSPLAGLRPLHSSLLAFIRIISSRTLEFFKHVYNSTSLEITNNLMKPSRKVGSFFIFTDEEVGTPGKELAHNQQLSHRAKSPGLHPPLLPRIFRSQSHLPPQNGPQDTIFTQHFSQSFPIHILGLNHLSISKLPDIQISIFFKTSPHLDDTSGARCLAKCARLTDFNPLSVYGSRV